MNSCRACISAGRAPFYIWQILNTSVVRLIIRNYVDTWLRRKNYANPLMFRIGAANSFCELLPEFFQLTLLKPIKDENLLSYVWNGYIIFKNTHFRHHFFIDKPYWRGLRNDRSYIYIYTIYIHLNILGLLPQVFPIVLRLVDSIVMCWPCSLPLNLCAPF